MSTTVIDRPTKTRREVTPRLTCIITGKSRLTNAAYLQSKATLAGSVETYLKNYISREALKHLRAGKSVEETRSLLNVTDYSEKVSPEQLTRAIKINGKWAKS